MSTEPPARPGAATAIIGPAVHAVLLFGLLGLYVGRVPAAKRTFDEFGMTLPWVTLTVIRLSNWLCEYGWALVPFVVIGCAAEFVITWWFGGANRAAAVLWVVSVAVLLGAFGALTVYSIELPMMKLREGLAR
ncbi:MAG TPA: hypothetical protein VGE74_11335 [Gemmata sp.]